jgi:hypothetical protein
LFERAREENFRAVSNLVVGDSLLHCCWRHSEEESLKVNPEIPLSPCHIVCRFGVDLVWFDGRKGLGGGGRGEADGHKVSFGRMRFFF